MCIFKIKYYNFEKEVEMKQLYFNYGIYDNINYNTKYCEYRYI